MAHPTRRIGVYELVAKIGQGGTGVVYRARDPKLDRDVALKLLLQGATENAVRLRRFEREVDALSRCRHPSVVRVHEASLHEGCPYVVMALVEGESLQSRLNERGPLPVEEAARICLDLAQGLEAAHAQGVLHRDVKPANVVLTTEGAPILIDFGLARDLDESRSSLTKSGRFLGTPGYWPPEMAAGKIELLGPGVDVYSLGATLYALLTGGPPFEGEALWSVIEATVQREPVPPRELRQDLDPALEAICLRCLEKDPAQRYPTCAALAADLGRFLKGEPVSARASSPLTRLLARLRRHALLIAIPTLAAAVLAAVVAFGTDAADPVSAPVTSEASSDGGKPTPLGWHVQVGQVHQARLTTKMDVSVGPVSRLWELDTCHEERVVSVEPDRISFESRFTFIRVDSRGASLSGEIAYTFKSDEPDADWLRAGFADTFSLSIDPRSGELLDVQGLGTIQQKILAGAPQVVKREGRNPLMLLTDKTARITFSTLFHVLPEGEVPSGIWTQERLLWPMEIEVPCVLEHSRRDPDTVERTLRSFEHEKVSWLNFEGRAVFAKGRIERSRSKQTFKRTTPSGSRYLETLWLAYSTESSR